MTHSFFFDETSCLSSCLNLGPPIIEIRTCSELRGILQPDSTIQMAPLFWDKIEMHFQECENG